MKTTDNSSGCAWKSINATKKKNEPGKATAEIALANKLDDIKFTSAKNYDNNVIGQRGTTGRCPRRIESRSWQKGSTMG